MTDPKGFASLSPTLLARKGAAKPAMRPQLQPLQQFHAGEDLGWNDMGQDDGEDTGAEIVPIAPSAGTPEVIRQRAKLTASIARHSASRQSALSRGGRAAFTLRLDAERHLRLRLASAVEQRSAQQLVTEALDRYLETSPDIAELAETVRKRC